MTGRKSRSREVIQNVLKELSSISREQKRLMCLPTFRNSFYAAKESKRKAVKELKIDFSSLMINK